SHAGCVRRRPRTWPTEASVPTRQVRPLALIRLLRAVETSRWSLPLHSVGPPRRKLPLGASVLVDATAPSRLPWSPRQPRQAPAGPLRCPSHELPQGGVDAPVRTFPCRPGWWTRPSSHPQGWGPAPPRRGGSAGHERGLVPILRGCRPWVASEPPCATCPGVRRWVRAHRYVPRPGPRLLR